MFIAAKAFFSSFEVPWFCLTRGYCKREMRNSGNEIANENSSKIDPKTFKTYLKNVAYKKSCAEGYQLRGGLAKYVIVDPRFQFQHNIIIVFLIS